MILTIVNIKTLLYQSFFAHFNLSGYQVSKTLGHLRPGHLLGLHFGPCQLKGVNNGHSKPPGNKVELVDSLDQ